MCVISIFVSITDQPEFTTQPQNKTVTEGNNVSFSCNAIGNPEATFSWTINGAAVNTTANPRISLSSQNKQLTITNVSRTDSGQYQCTANNAIGMVAFSNAATLDVQCKYNFMLFVFILPKDLGCLGQQLLLYMRITRN